MDTAFVTGATGFVGANLVRLLLKEGFRVRALARAASDTSNLDGLDVDMRRGDLLDESALEEACREARYVFHVAADYRIFVPDPEAMYASNIRGTVNVVRAATRAGAERIVHCSSVAAVRPPSGDSPADESSEYEAASKIIGTYKKSKWLSEREALALARSGSPVVVVNPAAPIGPYDIKPTPTGRIVVDFLNRRLPSYLDTGMNVVHVEDAALGHLLAARKGKVGERYILGGENLTFKGILDILERITGLPAPRFKAPYPVALAFGAIDTLRARIFGGEPIAPLDAVRMAKYRMYYDASKARKELGLPHSSAERALRDAALWFCRNGYAPVPPRLAETFKEGAAAS